MAINWSLAGNGYNPLEALQAYGQAHTAAARKSAFTTAAGGDFVGARKVAAQEGDTALYNQIGSMQDDQRKQLAAHGKTLANVAFGLKSVPEAQRAQVFATTIAPQLKAQGFAEAELSQANLSDAGLDGYISMAADIGKALEPYTLAPGAERRVGSTVIASNAAEETPLIRSLRSAGIDPQSPQGQGIITQNLNPPQFTEFGSDATGRQLIQTRGGEAAPAPAGGGIGGTQIEQLALNTVPGARVTSGARTPEHNREVGGKPNSYHLTGQARDFVPPQGMTMGQFDQTIRPTMEAQGMRVINEGDHIHVQPASRNGGGGPRVVASSAPVIPRASMADAHADARIARQDELQASRDRRTDRRAEGDLRKEFSGLPEVKDFKDVRASMAQVRTLATKKNASPQDDIALVFSYMKMLDPGSVVREGEFATAAKAAGVDDRIVNYIRKAETGNLLNDSQRKEIGAAAASVYAQRRGTYNSAADRYQGIAENYGFNGRSIAPHAIPTPRDARAALPAGWKIRRIK